MKKINWPTVSKKDLIEEEINFVVQINSKKKSILKLKRDITEKDVLETIELNKKHKKI